MEIEKAYWSRRTWADGKRRRLEECLNEVIEGLIQAALIDKRRREERQRQRCEWEEQERQRRQEQEEIAQLDDWIGKWRRGEEIRQFVAAARQALASIPSGSEAELWLKWADDYASRIDPLVVQVSL